MVSENQNDRKISDLYIPKYVEKILNHFYQCYKGVRIKGNCIRCFDTIAFSILYMEENNIILPKSKRYFISSDSKVGLLSKFFKYSISNRTCKYGINHNDASDFFRWLLKLNLKEKGEFKGMLIAHSEIKKSHPLKKGIEVYDKKTKTFKEI